MNAGQIALVAVLVVLVYGLGICSGIFFAAAWNLRSSRRELRSLRQYRAGQRAFERSGVMPKPETAALSDGPVRTLTEKRRHA